MVKATIYTDRLQCLIAKASDSRDCYEAEVEYVFVNSAHMVTLYGLANTEHQFKLALTTHFAPRIRKLTARDIQQAMAEELTALSAK